MYELNRAAYSYSVEKAYRRPLLRRMVDAISPGENDRIWGEKTFYRQRKTYN